MDIGVPETPIEVPEGIVEDLEDVSGDPDLEIHYFIR
jgi:hypothetical protein